MLIYSIINQKVTFIRTVTHPKMYHCQSLVLVFFEILPFFREIFSTYLVMNSHSFWAILSCKNGVQWKKHPAQPPVAFPWDKHHTWYAAKSFMHIYAYLVTQNIKKVSTERFWFDEINFFFCIIKDSLQWKWLFFLQLCDGEEFIEPLWTPTQHKRQAGC